MTATPPVPPRHLSAEDTFLITRALADRRRYGIVAELAGADGPTPCCNIGAIRDVTPSTVTHHLHQLEQAGLVEITRDGRFLVLRFRRDHYDRYLRQLAADAAPRG